MNNEKSTPLGGEPPQESESEKPQVTMPGHQQQLHDPDSEENLLKSGRPLSAKDLQPQELPVSSEQNAELNAAEERLLQEQGKQEQPSASLPPQPEMGMPDRPPQTTEVPQSEERNNYDFRTLPGSRKSMELYSPPEVPITNEDMERLLECIIHNKHYSEEFEKGPVKILFRVKSAKEVDFQRANLSKAISTGEFALMSDFQAAVARYNQLFQVVTYNGKEVAPVKIPPRPWKAEDLNLEEQYWSSWLSEITDSAGYVIHGLMIQFEDKIYRMQQRVLEPDFIMPAAPSSSVRD